VIASPVQPLESPFVFLSYASPDRERVLPIYDFLSSNGIGVWMDVRSLLPGQDWKLEIKRALSAAAAVIVVISRNSVDRTGYVQSELRMVLEKLDEQPAHRIFAIPVLLDEDARLPDLLKHLHALTLTDTNDQGALLQAVHHAVGKVEQTREDAQMAAEIKWRFGSLKEAWQGQPGYEAEVTWPIYQSTRYPLVGQISDAIRSELHLMVAAERAVKLDQLPEIFSFGKDEVLRTNALRVRCEEPVIKNRVLSQQLEIYWYGAGAMHGNYGFSSWVFVLDPLVRITHLTTVFTDADEALATLQTEVRPLLLAQLEQQAESVVPHEDRLYWMEAIVSGTADWTAFGNFGFSDTGLLLLFPPYQVAPYSAGALSVEVPYASIFPLLRRPYADALGLSWMEFEEPIPWGSLDNF
jgi:hypothetical protein